MPAAQTGRRNKTRPVRLVNFEASYHPPALSGGSSRIAARPARSTSTRASCSGYHCDHPSPRTSSTHTDCTVAPQPSVAARPRKRRVRQRGARHWGTPTTQSVQSLSRCLVQRQRCEFSWCPCNEGFFIRDSLGCVASFSRGSLTGRHAGQSHAANKKYICMANLSPAGGARVLEPG